ncbi:formate dehydrogenase subunit gamma [Marimonas sp. MJW-29]|uniref:Formate dehydrogenase subunit gamma n=1 Tax=Sulfitobacter sediminis TaxID=3234186 RepID=A0ABV3RJP9_9RHOB
MVRALLAAALTLLVWITPIEAQQAPEPDRSATGGAQTLEDILARQRGEKIDNTFRSSNTGDPSSAAGIADQLGTLGGASDSETWRALRFGSADVTVSSGGEVATVLMQDGGMAWLSFRDGPLRTYGGYGLLAMIGLLAVFFLLRGRIRVDGELTGRTVTRFKAVERFAHWLLAGSFILLGITGLLTLFGRVFILPTFGPEANSFILIWGKWVHNNVAWAFMIALVMVFFMWVWHNIPDRTDLTWVAQAGGIVGKKHPPAKKFNAGQKVIFWSVIVLGGSISVSGLSLLFPFELPLFAKTFVILNDIGAPGWIGMQPLPTQLSPQEEMQLAQAWHAIVSFVLMAIIIAHIYIGTLGMEGAYDAMGSGEVDEAWAHQHHSIWLEEVKKAEAPRSGATTPAE